MSAQQEVIKPQSSQFSNKNMKNDQNDQPALLPKVDVIEDATGITLLADLPGVSKDKLALNIEGEILEIEGEIASSMPEEMKAIYAEIQIPRYRRLFTLSRELDSNKIEASFNDGVLNLRIPKMEHAKPRKIEVKLA